MNNTSHAIQTVMLKEGGSAEIDATAKNVATVEADTTTGIEITVATAKAIMTTEIDVTIVANTIDRIVARHDAAMIDETVLIMADMTVMIDGIIEMKGSIGIIKMNGSAETTEIGIIAMTGRIVGTTPIETMTMIDEMTAGMIITQAPKGLKVIMVAVRLTMIVTQKDIAQDSIYYLSEDQIDGKC